MKLIHRFAVVSLLLFLLLPGSSALSFSDGGPDDFYKTSSGKIQVSLRVSMSESRITDEDGEPVGEVYFLLYYDRDNLCSDSDDPNPSLRISMTSVGYVHDGVSKKFKLDAEFRSDWSNTEVGRNDRERQFSCYVGYLRVTTGYEVITSDAFSIKSYNSTSLFSRISSLPSSGFVLTSFTIFGVIVLRRRIILS